MNLLEVALFRRILLLLLLFSLIGCLPLTGTTVPEVTEPVDVTSGVPTEVVSEVPSEPPTVVPEDTPEATPTREIVELTRTRFSYNINGTNVQDKDYLLNHLQEVNPSSVLIMNNLPLADEIYNLLGGNSVIVHRTWSSLEGDEFVYRPIPEVINQWLREGYPHIVRYDTNEPSFGGNISVEQYTRYEIELMSRAREAGFTVAVGNFGVGRIQPGWIEDGLFDGFLRAIDDHEHILAVHEYTQACLCFGVGVRPTSIFNSPEAMQPSNWPTISEVPLDFWELPAFSAQAEEGYGITQLREAYDALGFSAQAGRRILPPYWHLRRADWFLLRADELGIERPKILVTEFGWDNLSDLDEWIDPLDHWAVESPNLRGVRTYRQLWAWYWPQWSFAEALYLQVGWAEYIYPPDYIGFHAFSWTQSDDWLQTDFSELYEFHRLLEQ